MSDRDRVVGMWRASMAMGLRLAFISRRADDVRYLLNTDIRELKIGERPIRLHYEKKVCALIL